MKESDKVINLEAWKSDREIEIILANCFIDALVDIIQEITAVAIYIRAIFEGNEREVFARAFEGLDEKERFILSALLKIHGETLANIAKNHIYFEGNLSREDWKECWDRMHDYGEYYRQNHDLIVRRHFSQQGIDL